MQDIIVYILFGGAVFYLGYRGYKSLAKKDTKGCGSDGCSSC